MRLHCLFEVNYALTISSPLDLFQHLAYLHQVGLMKSSTSETGLTIHYFINSTFPDISTYSTQPLMYACSILYYTCIYMLSLLLFSNTRFQNVVKANVCVVKRRVICFSREVLQLSPFSTRRICSRDAKRKQEFSNVIGWRKSSLLRQPITLLNSCFRFGSREQIRLVENGL